MTDYTDTLRAKGLDQESLLTRKEAANFLGVKPQTLAVWASNQRYPLPVVKMGRLANYRVRDLLHFAQQRTTVARG